MQDKLLSNEEIKRIDSFYSKVQKGMVLTGKVKNIQSYGVFVELDKGITGLLHITNISTGRVRNPNERFEVGQNINVMIKKVDSDTGKIILTHKELLGTWEENIKDFNAGDIVPGIVREKDRNGIFIELKPNLIGLAEYKSSVNYGENVQVKIKKILPDKHKIKLVILD